MTRYNFTKTLRNTQISDNKKKARREFYGCEVVVNPSDKLRLENFCNQELTYFNNLISIFNIRVRNSTQQLIDLNKDFVSLFGSVAEYKTPVTPFLQKNQILPDNLLPFENIIYGKDKSGNRILTEQKASLIDIGSSWGVILPVVRKNMALELLQYYQEQAVKFLTPGSLGSEGPTYKVAPELLDTVTSTQKRHLQIPKECIKLKWDSVTESTILNTQYTENSIILPNKNLLENFGWTHLIIHQEAGRFVNPMTPWVIDIKKLNCNYFIKFLDNNHPEFYNSFKEAKKKY